VTPEPVPSSGGRKPFFKWLVSSPVGIVGLGLTGVGLGGGIGFALASKRDYDNANSIASQITDAAAFDAANVMPRSSAGTAGLCASPGAWMNKINYPMNTSGTRLRPYQTELENYSNACTKYQNNVHNADTFKTVSTVGFVVAGVAAVGTVVYYFVDPNANEKSESARASRRSVALVPSVGPGERGLSVVGSF
jgi:hypothetical protein